MSSGILGEEGAVVAGVDSKEATSELALELEEEVGDDISSASGEFEAGGQAWDSRKLSIRAEVEIRAGEGFGSKSGAPPRDKGFTRPFTCARIVLKALRYVREVRLKRYNRGEQRKRVAGVYCSKIRATA